MEPHPDELQKFLESQPASTPATDTTIPAIEKDLVASRLRLSVTYVLGAALGYILSLVICAQCSVGLTPFAWDMASLIHTIPDPWCPLLCGFIFGFSPTLVSFLYLSRFQHRFLIFRMGWLPALVPLIGCAGLLWMGDSHNWTWRAIWTLAAVLTPYGLELAAAIILRQARWKASEGFAKAYRK